MQDKADLFGPGARDQSCGMPQLQTVFLVLDGKRTELATCTLCHEVGTSTMTIEATTKQ